jgi:lactoylglutathione lyase
MRHIFTAQLSPTYSITYMGHSQGGRNGTSYQSGPELLRDKNNLAGLIEFDYLADAADEAEKLASTRRANTFSHIGLIVPDLVKAQERFEAMGVNVTKALGVYAIGLRGVENALGVGEAALEAASEEEREAIAQGQALVGFQKLLVIEDPDGNMIEVQQLVPPPGVA